MANLPVSSLLKQGSAGGEEFDQRRTKDDYRKQKDLEEQRKAGTAPAMVDIETGRDINPHIPEFIEKTPWYVPHDGPTLQHQRPHPEREQKRAALSEWIQKGTTGRVAKKFRKGACENCGAMGHNKKNCFERPRSKGAKFTESNMAPDDFSTPNLKLDYAAKRDRWNGFDPATYKEVAEDYEKMEETRKLIKNKNIQDGLEQPPEVEGDEDRYADDAVAPQSVDMDSRTRITVRNLRIREDTAKYLHNLDPNGPYYDPKSRSMRENPFAGRPGKEQEAAKFAGENFVRYSGEVVQANKAQVFAWAAKRKGIDVHSLAEPTKLEQLQREFEKESSGTKNEVKNKLLEKYGGEEHLKAPPKELLLAQTENYVEYNRKGNLIKGVERAPVKSKYEEDVYPGNHTSVFGSWYKEGKWGYKCCHSLMKNSYCLGEKGYEVAEQFAQTDAINQRQKLFQKKEDQPGTSGGDKDGKTKKEKDSEGKGDEKLKKDKDSEDKHDRSQDSDSSSESGSSSESSTDSSDSESEDDKKKQNKKKTKEQIEKEKEAKKKAKEEKKKEKEVKKAMKKVEKDKIAAIRENKQEEMNERKRKYNSHYEEFGKKPTEVELEAYNRTRIESSDPMASFEREKLEKKAKKSKK
ncbi:unnamed protein product [Bursaphelenchus okinawaensis]|uniref:Pre-mRNA-splicing factor SLU7 n=1 Tax=Bursaphelenchus okinawaensis TaxID=465554 RepID=A0A811LJB2_9BILA|nr:unnamed protein product [Bursaphelenchus okinawaensis]CAG9123496.1 unnamed protein product [Bursaphelenchus okinawaensis]